MVYARDIKPSTAAEAHAGIVFGRCSRIVEKKKSPLRISGVHSIQDRGSISCLELSVVDDHARGRPGGTTVHTCAHQNIYIPKIGAVFTSALGKGIHFTRFPLHNRRNSKAGVAQVSRREKHLLSVHRRPGEHPYSNTQDTLFHPICCWRNWTIFSSSSSGQFPVNGSCTAPLL